MWDMKEWFLRFVVHAVWRRRKGFYYAVSLISIVGNLVVLVGPSLHESIESRYEALHAAWSMLPQVAEVVLHRSVLYILLNLIVLRIMVKSGVLSRTSAAPIKPDEFGPTSSYFRTSFGVLPNIKPDEVCPASNTYYHVVQGAPRRVSNTYSMCSTQEKVDAHACSGPSMLPQQAHGDCKSTVTSTNVGVMLSNVGVISMNVGAISMDMCVTSYVPQHRNNHASWDNKQTKCSPAPSLFTIEPLNELLQEATEHQTLDDDQSDAHMSKTPEHRMRKVISRADLHMSVHACNPMDSMRAELPQRRIEQSVHVVAAAKKHKADRVMTCKGEHDDNELSRQEFNERVDTFISKFKRNLTMQRQNSFNRLLGLVGGGGDMIRLIK